MPRNGSGSYTLPQSPFVPLTTISSSAVNSNFSDIQAALTQSVSADGQTAITGQLKALSGSANSPSYSFTADGKSGLYLTSAGNMSMSANGVKIANATSAGFDAGAATVPVGGVLLWHSTSLPTTAVGTTQWAYCNGQSLSTTTYATLFGILGTNYGGSGGSFNIPDWREIFPLGIAGMGGTGARGFYNPIGYVFNSSVVGEVNHTLSATEMPVHNHGINDPTHAHGVADPTHAHGYSDPGHSHSFPVYNVAGAAPFQAMNGGSSAVATVFDSAVGVGITISAAATGIGIFAAGTGISTQNAGSGGTHNNVPQSMQVAYIMRIL